MRKASVLLASVLALAGGPVAADEAAIAPSILPLDEVRAGMLGRGRTVFEGGRLEEFDVRILGVLENASPRRNLILARLEGGPLATTGVIAGMSGSPVWIDGRLVGAVSSGWAFAKEPIAGITPIEEMLAIPTRDWGPHDGRMLYLFTGDEAMSRLDAIERGEHVSPVERLKALATPDPGAAGLPVVLAGYDPRAFEAASGLLGAFGLTARPAAGVARDADGAPGPDSLAPGAPVGIELVRGDYSMAAFGTVTSRSGDEVLAFGHPLFNVGSVSFPLATASVVAVMPSLVSSFKISSLGRTVGALRQDRSAGVMGRIGAEAPMVPVRLAIRRGGALLEEFSFEVATHRLLTPVLVQLSLASSFLATEKQSGASTIDLRGRIAVEGHDDVAIDHFFTGDGSGGSASSLVAAITDLLLGNDLGTAPIEEIALTAEYLEDNRFAQVDRVWTSRARVRPGEQLEVRARLRHARGGEEVVGLSLRVPEDAARGELELAVGDAVSLARHEARARRHAPRTLDQLIGLVNEIRNGATLYAQLSRPDAGVSVGGARLTGLPPSAYALITGGSGADALGPIRREPLAEARSRTAHQVAGLRTLRIQVDGDAE